jgi:SAM-dependent methyltransferase
LPKILIAVKSCEADIAAGHNQCIRDTWGKHIESQDVSLRFFPGRGNGCLQADEVRVDAPDDYLGLPRKTCAIVRYAQGLGFDFIFLCDTDTFVRPELLLASGFENFDLMGYFGNRIPGQQEGDGYYAWPSGGGGYWLSVQSMPYIAENQDFSEWAEDRQVGQLLGPHIASGKLKAVNSKVYGAPIEWDHLVTAHYESQILKRKYDPQWMRALYKRFYPETPMNIQEYEEKFEQFDIASQNCGQPRPPQERKIAVIDDDTADHHDRELEWQYVMHCGWAAGRLGKRRPRSHVDFGSYVYFAAICSQFIPHFQFYDIRGLEFDIPGLLAAKMDLTSIQFPDNSVDSVSCLHTLEHVGLGRYGDTLDPEGHIKGARELIRIVRPNGRLLIVLPMSESPYVAFNAHRMLSLGMVYEMFNRLTTVEACFLHNKKFLSSPPLHADQYVGCFEFTK